MGKLLNQINKPNDIKRIPARLYPVLSQEIRDFLIENVSRTGGHLASNLGAVEITMALHLCLTLPKDKIVFDVGHQSYVHKLLTGRKDGFSTLRQKGGMSGFPKRWESDCDAFGAGHSSTSIAAAIGLATARDLRHGDETVVALIGDGALSGGMAFEAMNNLAGFRKEKRNFIILLNDNKMSISENVGGLSRYLNDIRSRKSYGELKENVETALNNIPGFGHSVARTLKKSKDSLKQLVVPGMYFENMGITYYGPVDGHDIFSLIQAINRAKKMDGPILIHAITKKGKGYEFAENDPEKFHGIGPFDIATGNVLGEKKRESWTKVFSQSLVRCAKTDERIVAVTAAMPSGTGLTTFKERYPKRFFDVGIAEEYAVTFAAGMAAAGLRPVVAIYSSFLQRAYDQILHDVCIQKLPIFFCIDRSGLVGADGETHQGVFDISYLGHLPNLVLLAPKNRYELEDMMEFALRYDGPIAMRYPRGETWEGMADHREPIRLGKSERIAEGDISPEHAGRRVLLLSVGNMMEECEKAVRILREQKKDYALDAGLCNVRFVHPFDEEMLHWAAAHYDYLVTVEENELAGGFGQMISAFLHQNAYETGLISLGIPDRFVSHATVKEQREDAGIDAASIAARILERVWNV